MTTQAGCSDGHGHGRSVTVTALGPRSTMTESAAPQQPRRRRNDLHQLDVYRCALQLYRAVRRIVKQFPRGEGDLRNQMRRASRSVPFNIGEGVGKRGRARAAAYEIALGETKELIVALDCVEIDELARLDEIIEAQDLGDRIAAMLTRLIASAEGTAPRPSVDRGPWTVADRP